MPKKSKALSVLDALKEARFWNNRDISGFEDISPNMPMLLARKRVLSSAVKKATELDAVAREALQFIMKLRDGSANEALDLITNNAGEDVEARLAAALGVDLDAQEEEQGDAASDVHVIEAASLDNSENFDSPWLVQFQSGRIDGYSTEAAACAYQRKHRRAAGLNPMTGEKD